MRAVRLHEYGGPEVLRLEEVERPAPGPRDVLIKVMATAVNPVDWKIRSGGQRSIIRYRLPWILGLDVSGVVEAVGAEVTTFRPGDAVWSSPRHTRPGTYAEYVAVDAAEVSLKPRNLSHVEAASLPLVGLTAYQCLVDAGHLQAGQRVLIHAGAGGVGTFAIQLARHLGAHVITTTSARNADFVRSLGAHEVIDYTRQRITELSAPVDLVLDSIGESVLADNVVVLKRGGRLSSITVDVPGHVARHGPVLGLVTLGAAMVRLYAGPWLAKRIRVQHVIKRCDGAQLAQLAGLVEAGVIKPIVDRVLPLGEIQAAHRHSESHHARGKIVIAVGSVT